MTLELSPEQRTRLAAGQIGRLSLRAVGWPAEDVAAIDGALALIAQRFGLLTGDAERAWDGYLALWDVVMVQFGITAETLAQNPQMLPPTPPPVVALPDGVLIPTTNAAPPPAPPLPARPMEPEPVRTGLIAGAPVVRRARRKATQEEKPRG